MEITIKGEPKEIAALALAIQERQSLSTKETERIINLLIEGSPR